MEHNNLQCIMSGKLSNTYPVQGTNIVGPGGLGERRN